MLKEIITILKTEKTPLSVESLSKRLDVERSALEGMLVYLEQKGIISGQQNITIPSQQKCQGFSCMGCPASVKCPFAGKLPQRYTLVERK